GHNPSKLELLWLVCWDNFDVLTDWHNTNELWVCCTVNGSWRNDLGNHDVCAPDVSVKTGLENLTLCNRIDLTAARSLTTAGSPVEDVGELSDVHEVLRCYKVPTINLSLDLNEVSLEKTTIRDVLKNVLNRCSSINSSEDVCIFLCHKLLASFLHCTVDYVESTTTYLRDTNGWVGVKFECWNYDSITEYTGFTACTVRRNNSSSNIDISLVLRINTLWERVNYQKSTCNSLVVQVTTNWVCHCLSKSKLSFLCHDSASNQLVALLIVQPWLSSKCCVRWLILFENRSVSY